MRRTSLALFLAASCAAQACSGPNVQELIHANVVFASECLAGAVAVTGISIFMAMRQKRRYWIPVVMLPFALITWNEIGGAYGGDCGSTAISSGILSVLLCLTGLWAQFLTGKFDERRAKSNSLRPNQTERKTIT